MGDLGGRILVLYFLLMPRRVLAYDLREIPEFLFPQFRVLMHGNRIVDIRFDWHITQEQMAVAGKKLRK